MPFVITLYGCQPPLGREPKPPLLDVPVHMKSFKSRMPTLHFPDRPEEPNYSTKSELWTFSTGYLANVFGGTWPASEFAEKAQWYRERFGEDVDILDVLAQWVALYPDGWFQNG